MEEKTGVFNVKTYSGVHKSIAISALQKAIRRGESDKAKRWLLECLYTNRSTASNALNRLLVILFEDVGPTDPLFSVMGLHIFYKATSYHMLDEKRKRDVLGCYFIDMLCASKKTRLADYSCCLTSKLFKENFQYLVDNDHQDDLLNKFREIITGSKTKESLYDLLLLSYYIIHYPNNTIKGKKGGMNTRNTKLLFTLFRDLMTANESSKQNQSKEFIREIMDFLQGSRYFINRIKSGTSYSSGNPDLVAANYIIFWHFNKLPSDGEVRKCVGEVSQNMARILNSNENPFQTYLLNSKKIKIPWYCLDKHTYLGIKNTSLFYQEGIKLYNEDQSYKKLSNKYLHAVMKHTNVIVLNEKDKMRVKHLLKKVSILLYDQEDKAKEMMKKVLDIYG